MRSGDVQAEPPYLTVVVTGRNDGYGGDFVGRFLRTVAFNARNLRDRGIPWELILVEWAPPADRPLLTDLLLEGLPASAEVLRSFVVDPRYHDAVTLNARIQYHEFTAKNVGIRHARAPFVLTTNADICLGRHVLDRFERRELQRRLVYRARRTDLKFGIDSSAIDWDLLEDARNYDSGTKPLRPPLYSGGTGDFVLLDAATFAELRGFNEVYRVAKFGIDKNFLVKALSANVPIADIGGPVYHFNHVGSYRITKAQYRERQEDAPYGDRRWPSGSIVYDNPDTWGLARAPAVAVSDFVTRLVFDWAAVPRLLELHRVLQPGIYDDEDAEEG